jgi:hypothetical protein
VFPNPQRGLQQATDVPVSGSPRHPSGNALLLPLQLPLQLRHELQRLDRPQLIHVQRPDPLRQPIPHRLEHLNLHRPRLLRVRQFRRNHVLRPLVQLQHFARARSPSAANPPAAPLTREVHPILWAFASEAVAQELGEEIVIATVETCLVHRNRLQVAAVKIVQQSIGVRATGERVATRLGQGWEHGCVEEEAPQRRRLAVEHLFY